jgi:hypothetical protein
MNTVMIEGADVHVINRGKATSDLIEKCGVVISVIPQEPLDVPSMWFKVHTCSLTNTGVWYLPKDELARVELVCVQEFQSHNTSVTGKARMSYLWAIGWEPHQRNLRQHQ